MHRGAAVVWSLIAAGAMAAAQPAPTIHDSYQQARRLLDRAVAAHGGLESLRRARRSDIEFAGDDVWRHQSRTAAPPYDRRAAAGRLRIDVDAGRLIYELSRSYPGNIPRRFAFVTSPGQSHYRNHQQRTYRMEDYPPPDQQINNVYYVPQLILGLAHESGPRLRSLGALRLTSGTMVNAITTTAAGASMTLGLDPATDRLRAVLSVRTDAVAGDTAAEIEFLDYRDVEGLLTPGRRTLSIGGEMVEDFEYRRVGYGNLIADALVAPPAGYEVRAPVEAPRVRQLADNVWLVGGASASLVVALGDEVIVIDASPSAAATVMSQLPKLAPGKKLAYVVPTHHHDDHAPGVRTLARDGATVLTTAGSKALLERIIGRPVQTIAGGRHVFAAGDRSVEIHDIGPSPHADEMLVAWLPKEGILFEADLLDVTPPGTIEAGANNDTTTHFARWLSARPWVVRQFVGAHGGVIDAAGFKRLLAAPVAQP